MMFKRSVLLLASFVAAGALAPRRASAQPAVPADIDARAEAILHSLTLEQKAGQLNQLASGSLTGPERHTANGDDVVRSGLVGSLLNVQGEKDTNAVQREATSGTGAHIPLLFGLDVIHGYRTIFPVPLGLSASWDPQIAELTARRAAVEASSQGIRWTFAPMVDIARDARWGRITESAGEDPYLGSLFAKAYVRGFQGRSLSDPTSILACAKHFVGYGAAEGGREYNTTEISERSLRETYLPPFKAALDAGVATFMSAFNCLDGVPSSANAFTLTQVLRREWGFSGFVVSDWTSVREIMVHGIADDEATAARKAFLAGVDMDMQSDLFLPYLPELVRSGKVSEARVDDAVRRILRLKLALGLFEKPYTDPTAAAAPLVTEESRELARRAAQESFVLLRNQRATDAPLLPLKGSRGLRVALIGPLADSGPDMLGSWSCAGRGEDVVTLRTALGARAKRDGFSVTYEKGTSILGGDESGFSAAVAAAGNSDVVVMALGENAHSSGEASAKTDIGLPGNQEKLLEAVVATGRPVVLVVFSGRPLALAWAAEHVPAILMAWFPGVEAGPALVGTLLGDSEPSGRLTASMPRSVGQEPIYYNTLNTGRPRSDPIALGSTAPDSYYVTGYIDMPNTPLFPFGFGLGYTTFSYSAVQTDVATVSAAKLNSAGASIRVRAQVRNTGARAGTETVQLYVRLRGTSVALPIRELKGFQRLSLAPGESRSVEFSLGAQELAFWNIDMRREVEAGSLYVWVAPDSTSGEPARVTITD